MGEPLGTELRARKVARHAEAQRVVMVAIPAEAPSACGADRQTFESMLGTSATIKVAPDQLSEDHRPTHETRLGSSSGIVRNQCISVARRVQNPELVAAIGCAIFGAFWVARDSDSRLVDRILAFPQHSL